MHVGSGVVIKNEVGEREVGERLEIEVKTVATKEILQEFCLVWKKWGNGVPPRSPSTTPLHVGLQSIIHWICLRMALYLNIEHVCRFKDYFQCFRSVRDLRKQCLVYNPPTLLNCSCGMVFAQTIFVDLCVLYYIAFSNLYSTAHSIGHSVIQCTLYSGIVFNVQCRAVGLL